MEQAKTKKEKTIDIIKKVAWGILLAVFGFVAVTLVWLGIDKFIVKSPVPKAWGCATLTVVTGSMQGTIDVGDVIVIKKTNDYKLHDIVTYIIPGDKVPTTHRIWKINPDGTYITKGDANNTEDTTQITKDMIVGEVVKVIPNAGHFVNWLRMEGWLFVVSLLAIIGIGTLLIKANTAPEQATNTTPAKTDEAANSDGNTAEDSAKAENQTQTESNASNCDKDKNTDQKPQKKDDDA
ncbi:MAG: signal peptidase I [Clostridia bacterium]|nr:signal peptidase I [Clostridia bacterium]MBQ4587486.1 signal peptidase I [Clostridia bacterium]